MMSKVESKKVGNLRVKISTKKLERFPLGKTVIGHCANLTHVKKLSPTMYICTCVYTAVHDLSISALKTQQDMKC